ncbi:cupin domain-containing protein [Hymenobacter chitinivorans]|uniref:Cupin domain-containing protein n=1 Tax=Hymenobacter chitinivorans DSM 11115 TaxID=1121954 RepID=A0A2M9BST9_9BACT|nr:cupin domain-containing protein [Hymenobacter chitinivorans]PJJ61014.1 Cupin domain-containing protein [Hymenobacter chitinivorans DSM 11115]
MKRTHFVQACLATGALLTLPVSLAVGAIRRYRAGKGFLVKAGQDRASQPMALFDGDTFLTKIAAQDTEGDIYVFESSRVKEGGPAHHYHFDQDEWWYVLSGEFLIKVGDTVYEAKAGDSVFGPRMVPHSFAKVGAGEGRLLMIFQPAGKMEECFRKISQGLTRNMSEAEQDAFRVAHGFKRVGPPLRQPKPMTDK